MWTVTTANGEATRFPTKVDAFTYARAYYLTTDTYTYVQFNDAPAPSS